MVEVAENVVSVIVDADICIGCGICASICPSTSLKMEMNEFGEYKPRVLGECSGCGLCLKVCPFNDNQDNEDTLGQRLYDEASEVRHESSLGYLRKCYVGYVTDEKDRLSSASGGLASFVLKTLLNSKSVDGVITAMPTYESVPLFGFQIIASSEQLDEARGSVYYPLQMADVLREVITGPERRYAITALPCFAKAIRLAQQVNPELKRRIKFILGLTCGGCPNAQFTQLLSCTAGLANPERVNYRSKQEAEQANDYRFVCHTGNKVGRPLPLSSVFGFMWENGLFFHRSCDFCDDVFAELADMTFMDAWLSKYIPNSKGTSLSVCRNQYLEQLIEDQIKRGFLSVYEIPDELVLKSQDSVIQYKGAKLGFRLHSAQQLSDYVPVKRVNPAFQNQTHSRILKSLFKIQKQVKQDWHTHREQLFLRRCSSVSSRFKTWIFCLKLYKYLKEADMPIKKKWDVILPIKLCRLLRRIKRIIPRKREIIYENTIE